MKLNLADKVAMFVASIAIVALVVSFCHGAGAPSFSGGNSGGGGSTSPGGSDTQIQFNNSGAFGGSSNLTWDGAKLNVSTGASASVVIGQNAGATTYNTVSLNGSLSGTSALGFFGGGTGDNNLYFNRPSGGTIQFNENNTERFRMASGGNTGIGGKLGVGVLSPSYALSVGTNIIGIGADASMAANSIKICNAGDSHVCFASIASSAFINTSYWEVQDGAGNEVGQTSYGVDADGTQIASTLSTFRWVYAASSYPHPNLVHLDATGGTAGNLTLDTGSLILSTAGKTISIKSGTNQRAGNATLVGGTVTIANTTVTANTIVMLTEKTTGGTLGSATYTLSAGTSFTINSSSALDTSTYSYLLIEVP